MNAEGCALGGRLAYEDERRRAGLARHREKASVYSDNGLNRWGEPHPTWFVTECSRCQAGV